MAKVKKTGRFERVMTLTLDEAALAEGKRKAAARLSRESQIKGFRPGKAPLKIVESAVGAEAMRREAIEDAIPVVLGGALEEAELEPVIYPRLKDVRDKGEKVEVDVVVTMWPTVDDVPEYVGLEVEIDIPEVTDQEVDDQVEMMRNQFAELVDVSREAFDEDFVVVDIATTLGGAEYAAGSATDLIYGVGSGGFLPGMDDALRGTKAGAILNFDSTLPQGIGDDAGKEVSVRVLVKQVKAKQLSDLTDDWVSDVSEFEDVAEMRSELLSEMTKIRRRGAWRQVEDKALASLIEKLDVEVPDGLTEAEMDSILHRFVHRLEEQGISFEQYLEVTSQDKEQFADDLREQGVLNLKTRILLEAVADQEGITVEEEELNAAVGALAQAAGGKESESEGGRGVALAGDILRRKAIDRILDLVAPVDAAGNAVELPPRYQTDVVDAEVSEGAPPDEEDET
jgi:trigger factor